MKNTSKQKKRKTILFKISSFFVSKSKTPLSRFNVLVLCVIIISIGVNYGTYLIDIINKNILVGRYNQKYVQTISLSEFRQELNEEELLLDFDNDGITNKEEIEQKTQIYKSDSNFDGISDKYVIQHSESDTQINYNNVYNSVGLTQEDNEKQIKNILGVKSFDLLSDDIDAFAIEYNGVAFDGLKKLCNPFRIMNYIGDVEISNKKINKYLNDICNKGEEDNNLLLVVKYDLKKDKYEIIGSWYPDKDITSIIFSIKDDNPICIIGSNRDYVYDDSKSLKYTIALNRMKSTSFYAAKINNGESYKYALFSADSQVKLNENEQYLKDLSDITYFQVLSSGVNLQLQNRIKIDAGAYDELSKKDMFLNYIMISNKHVESIGEIKGKEILAQIQEKKYYSEIKVSSKGYLEDHKTKFDISKNSFSFNNFSTEANKDGVGFAMADIVSNYYNFKTLPQILANEEVQKKFKTKGINSSEYLIEESVSQDFYTYTLNDESIMQMLDKYNSNVLSSTYLTQNSKHANDKHCLDTVIKDIDNNKTVVAYMNNGYKSTAVVVYRITRDAIDPLKYNLYVYDPNYSNGNISLFDSISNETKNIRTDNCIKVKLIPYASINAKDQKISVSYKMTFEYGNFLDYYFGNSNKFHDGLLYSNGDLCFKKTVDISKNSEITFIN